MGARQWYRGYCAGISTLQLPTVRRDGRSYCIESETFPKSDRGLYTQIFEITEILGYKVSHTF